MPTMRNQTDAAGGRLIETVLAHADTRPDDIALTCGEQSLSWRELRERVLGMAGAIVAACGEPRARVATIAGTSLEHVLVYLGAVAAGCCAVPLAVSANADALAGMLENCDPALVFLDRAGWRALDGACSAPVVGLEQLNGPAWPLADFLEAATPMTAPSVPEGDAPFNIIYSSGTTGQPKGIVHSHAMRFRQSARSIFGIDPASVMLLATPLYSNTTLLPLLASLFHGGHTVLMPKFDAERYLDLAEQLGATHTMLVPVQYQRIVDAESFARRRLASFQVKQCTSAPLAPAVKERVARDWPGRFLEIYGLTEGGCTCILDVGAYPDKVATVGRPAPGNDIRVIDETGNELPAGERGEVIGRAAAMMEGYFRNPGATDAFYFHGLDGSVFHRTGDIGMFDDDGFLKLLDRKKDLIISGGFNIYASDLEEKLTAHPEVREAVVVAVPSESWGETPLGFVVLEPNATVTTEALLDWVNARVGKMQRISALEFRTELPRSGIGKVLKQELRAPYWADAKTT